MDDKIEEGKFIIEHGFTEILLGLNVAYGLDLSDENLKETPARVARAFIEMLQGIDKSKSEAVLRQNFPSKYDGMVIIDNIKCYSMCPHHFLPVKYMANFGYIPDGRVLGLSKIPRFIKMTCRAPMLQEDTTEIIVDKFMEIVSPRGCIVTLSGQHLCMGCRGVEMPDTMTVTSAIRGNFETPAIRQEFFETLKLRS